jgi:hypothetical protein
VREVLRIAREPISLETPLNEEEESHLGDFIVDRRVVSPSEAVINLNLREQTAEVQKTLSTREEKIIKMRFGLQNGADPPGRSRSSAQAAPPQPQSPPARVSGHQHPRVECLPSGNGWC